MAAVSRTTEIANRGASTQPVMALSIENLSHSFGSRKALDDVSFTIFSVLLTI